MNIPIQCLIGHLERGHPAAYPAHRSRRHTDEEVPRPVSVVDPGTGADEGAARTDEGWLRPLDEVDAEGRHRNLGWRRTARCAVLAERRSSRNGGKGHRVF